MAINYCDFLNGDDSTGDGTHGNPYKTINQASTGLTGGDEVRAAKSVDDSDLSGTLAFISGSTSITTSIDLTGDLIICDFIYKTGAPNELYEIINITTDTITLYRPYQGITETTTCKKLGVTDTGSANYGEHIQMVVVSGISEASRLKISGGWTLSTQIQDGKTFFRQTNTASRYGYGLGIQTELYIEIEKFGFLRYDHGIYLLHNSNYCIINSIICYGNRTSGIEVYYDCIYNSFNDIISNESRYGIYLRLRSENNIINNAICNNNTNHGIYLNANDNTINIATCNYNVQKGIFLSSSNNIIINTVTCNYNNHNGIECDMSSHFTSINIANCNYNARYGILIDSNNNIINEVVCCFNTQSGFIFENSAKRCELYTANFNNNTEHGIVFFSYNHIVTSLNCNDNNNYGIYDKQILQLQNIISKYYSSGNILGDVYIIPNNYISEKPILNLQHYNTEGDNRCYYGCGIMYRDTTEAKITQCLRFEPTSDTYYMMHNLNFTSLNNIEKIILFHIKDDGVFDGDVQAALYFMGLNITGWIEIPTTSNYVRNSLIARRVNITEDGILELRIKVRGTTGNVYVDDLGVI